MENIPDHPVIRNCKRYGYPDGPEEEHISVCPMCGKEAEVFYITRENAIQDILGCDKCVKEIDSFDYEDKYGGYKDEM